MHLIWFEVCGKVGIGTCPDKCPDKCPASEVWSKTLGTDRVRLEPWVKEITLRYANHAEHEPREVKQLERRGW
jgi:hypothetical protein